MGHLLLHLLAPTLCLAVPHLGQRLDRGRRRLDGPRLLGWRCGPGEARVRIAVATKLRAGGDLVGPKDRLTNGMEDVEKQG